MSERRPSNGDEPRPSIDQRNSASGTVSRRGRPTPRLCRHPCLKMGAAHRGRTELVAADRERPDSGRGVNGQIGSPVTQMGPVRARRPRLARSVRTDCVDEPLRPPERSVDTDYVRVACQRDEGSSSARPAYTRATARPAAWHCCIEPSRGDFGLGHRVRRLARDLICPVQVAATCAVG